MILFAIGAIPILLLLGTIHAAGRRHTWEKVIMSIADGFLLVVCLMFLIELAGISWHLIAVWICFAIAIEIWLIGWMWHWWRKRRRMIALLTYFALLVCARLGSEAYTQYLNNISYDDYFNPVVYYPTREGSLAIESEEPSELNITENMPVMDGATALCPVYAA